MGRLLRLVFLRRAVEDFERLRLFLRTRNPAASLRAAKCLQDAAERLRGFPYLGRPVPDIQSRDLRDLVVSFGKNGYIMRYFVTDDTVTIVRIWHGRENRDF